MEKKFAKKIPSFLLKTSLAQGKDENIAKMGVGDNVQISSKIWMYTYAIICWCQYEHLLPLNLTENLSQKFIPKNEVWLLWKSIFPIFIKP